MGGGREKEEVVKKQTHIRPSMTMYALHSNYLQGHVEDWFEEIKRNPVIPARYTSSSPLLLQIINHSSDAFRQLVEYLIRTSLIDRVRLKLFTVNDDSYLRTLVDMLMTRKEISTFPGLYFSRCPISLESLEYFANALSISTHITKIETIQIEKFAFALAKGIMQSPHLEVLEMLNISSSTQGVDVLFDVLTQAKNLKVKNIAYRNTFYDQIPQLANMLTQSTHMFELQSLDISFSNISQESFSSLCAALTKSTHLTFLEMLGFSYCLLDDECITSLANTLLVSKHLFSFRKLDLIENQITSLGIHRLTRCLIQATHLINFQELGVSLNAIGEEGAFWLSEWLVSSPHLASFKKLSVEACDIHTQGLRFLANAIVRATHLISFETLSFGDNDVQDEGMFFISECLMTSPHLTSLKTILFRCNQCSDDGIAHLANALVHATHLHHFDVLSVEQNDPIHEHGFEQLSRSVLISPHLSSLQRLNFGTLEFKSPKVFEQFAYALCQAKHLHDSLEELILRVNRIDDRGFRQFCSTFLSHLHRLRYLILRSEFQYEPLESFAGITLLKRFSELENHSNLFIHPRFLEGKSNHPRVRALVEMKTFALGVIVEGHLNGITNRAQSRESRMDVVGKVGEVDAAATSSIHSLLNPQLFDKHLLGIIGNFLFPQRCFPKRKMV